MQGPTAIAERRGAARFLRQPAWAVLVLLVAYGCLSLLDDPGGFLGTDTGGKVATVKVMSEAGSWDPDVGYWAADLDPTGRVHGLIYTAKVGDRWLNVTSLPMVLAARPLWDLGGYRTSLVLPMLGAIAAALAARSLARRLGDGDGMVAFWIVGLASPVTIYALDLWEHSIGVGLMGWATVVLFDAVFAPPRWWRGLVAGALYGAAFSMRSEALVYGFVTVALVGVLLVVGRRWLDAVVVGFGAIAGVALLIAANLGLEVAVLGASFRSGRAAGTAQGGGTDLGVRLREGYLTALSPFPGVEPVDVALTVVLVAGLGVAAWAATRPDRRRLAVGGLVTVVLVLLARASAGVGFVPGLAATTPFAIVAVVLGWREARLRFVVLAGLLPLPVVFWFQFAGGAIAQWGGRYVLTSGFVLAVAGVACRHRLDRPIRVGFVALAVAVTAFGVIWLSVRSHAFADVADAIEIGVVCPPAPAADRACSPMVLVAANGFLPREFGATYPRQRWLAAPNRESLDDALDVAVRAGPERIGVVAEPGQSLPELAGYERRAGEQTVEVLPGVELAVTTYTRTSPPTGP